MKEAGQIVLFRFPQADLAEGKLRPALLLGELPGERDDWLICMISTQLWHYVPDFDEIVGSDQVVTPREDLRENRPLDASEFAVHLDHIRLGRAHADYIEPKRFFDRTFFTQGLFS